MEKQIDMTFESEYEVLSCKSKRRYDTYWQAKFIADEQMARNRKLKLKIYQCKFCDGWHLSST